MFNFDDFTVQICSGITRGRGLSLEPYPLSIVHFDDMSRWVVVMLPNKGFQTVFTQ